MTLTQCFSVVEKYMIFIHIISLYIIFVTWLKLRVFLAPTCHRVVQSDPDKWSTKELDILKSLQIHKKLNTKLVLFYLAGAPCFVPTFNSLNFVSSFQPIAILWVVIRWSILPHKYWAEVPYFTILHWRRLLICRRYGYARFLQYWCFRRSISDK